MERLTYDFALGGNHCWQVKGADNLECREVCERQGDAGCKTCPIAKAFDRLAAYEDTSLEPEEVSDFDRLVKLYLEAGLDKQFVLACIEATKAGMTVDRLRELAQADREGRVEIIEPDVYECIKAARKAQAALRREQNG